MFLLSSVFVVENKENKRFFKIAFAMLKKYRENYNMLQNIKLLDPLQMSK